MRVGALGVGHAVIAEAIACQAAARNAEILGHAHVVVALAAGKVALVSGRDHRQLVGGGLDGVHAMAAGADGRLVIAFGQRLAVNAVGKNCRRQWRGTRPQVLGMLARKTGEVGSLGPRMSWLPWQSEQTAAWVLPAATSLPCTDS